MIFNTLQFIPFLFIVLVLHRLLPWKHDKIFLLIASYFFYASFNPPYLIILIVSTAIDYWVAKMIYASSGNLSRRFYLTISCVSNLAILCFFKYADFFMENLNYIFHFAGIKVDTPRFDFVLPVGISFYTFQSMSYTIDIYRKKLAPASLIDFSLYVSFFTQLVAGPIVRAIDFIPQLARRKCVSFNAVSLGIFLIVLGYFKKIVIADNIAEFIASVFTKPLSFSGGDLFCGLMGFATQIYCDFSGYSDIAIGLSLVMGFHLRRNFRIPYLARGFSDFWRRWHISLSTWIRDNIYIPLGGNRRGRARQAFNIMFTMSLCGFWHGASWMFIIWGALHGFYTLAERYYNEFLLKADDCMGMPVFASIRRNIIYKAVATLVTFALVCVGWVFFRASSMTDAFVFLGRLGRDFSISYRNEWVYIILVGFIHGIIFCNMHIFRIRKIPWYVYSIATAIMSFLIITAWESNNVFIYFQF